MSFSNLSKILSIASRKNNELASVLLEILHKYQDKPPVNLEPFLPMLFSFNGKPINLRSYYTMEPLFDLNPTRDTTLMCSRQVGKTMNLSLRTLINSFWREHWKPLFVTPFYETTRRISTDYFASLIQQSPCRHLFTGPGCTNQVLERTLPNHSRIRFTYAYRSGDRARGIPANECIYDESQLMWPEVVGVINATMNASPHGNITTCAGTPITNANHHSRRFKENSTRSHWMTPCSACGHKNIAAAEYDLLKMIGPLRDDISIDRPAIICAKCKAPLHPWEGQFVHLNPSKRKEHLGLHIPCIVLPAHCCNYDKWRDIWSVLSDSNTPEHTKYNEILGVPFDDGVSLLSQLDVESNATLHSNKLEDALKIIHLYQGRIAIGVDWGGRGISGESRTKIAVCGLSSNGQMHILFGVQLPMTADSKKEAEVIYHLYKTCRPELIAHDNIGIGSRAEEMLVSHGVPKSIIIPMEYVGETQGFILKRRAPSESNPKLIYSVDKTRGLLHLVEAYKSGQIRSFKFEDQYHARDLLLDFTHLIAEERVYVHSVKSETILIQKEPGQSDDFVHAVHHAANILWEKYKAWPKMTLKLNIITPQDLSSYMVELAKYLDPETIESLGLAPLDLST